VSRARQPPGAARAAQPACAPLAAHAARPQLLTPPVCARSPAAHAQRDGCPKIINLGQARTDAFYQAKKFGFVKNY